MPSLIRPQIVEYRDRHGNRVPKGTPGAKRIRRLASKWYGKGVPGYPPSKRIPLATDRAAAERMLEDLVRRAERGSAGLPDQDVIRTPLSEHIEQFGTDMALGMANRRRRLSKPSASHVAKQLGRLREAVTGCRWETVADLRSGARTLATYLDRRANLTRKQGGLSQQTAAYYLKVVRHFAWWLSVRMNAPIPPNVFDDLPGFDPASDRKHARRDLTADELARLLDAARSGPTLHTLTGEDRYHLYLTAFATGFRAGELATLTPESFDLTGCVVTLARKSSKNRKGARQPIPPGVAEQLKPFIDGKHEGKPVWPSSKRGWHGKAAGMIRRDLKAAGIPYRVDTPDGPRYADFHALRHSYLSALAASGINPRELQDLARHSTPMLTLGIYTHTRPEQLGAAVAKLPLPTSQGGV